MKLITGRVVLTEWDCPKKCHGKAIVKPGSRNRKEDNHTFRAHVPNFTPWEIMNKNTGSLRPIKGHDLKNLLRKFYPETREVRSVAMKNPMMWFLVNQKYRFRYTGGADQ